MIQLKELFYLNFFSSFLLIIFFKIIIYFFYILFNILIWGLGPIPNPQSPIPNPQSPLKIFFELYIMII